MTMNEYQEATAKTAIYPRDKAREYVLMGLANECGELLGVYKKVLRDQDGVLNPEAKQDFLAESGDILWYLSQVCSEFGLSLDVVATYNLNKLASRQARGVLGGSGNAR